MLQPFRTFRFRPGPGLDFHILRQFLIFILCFYSIHLQIAKNAGKQGDNDIDDNDIRHSLIAPSGLPKLTHFGLLSSNSFITKNKPTSNFRQSKFLTERRGSWLSVIIFLSGDLELNPGPGRKSSPKFPCGICQKACTWKQQAVACDTCDIWYHTKCMTMNSKVYDGLHNISWHCFRCGIPNFSSSLFSLSNSSLNHTHFSSHSPSQSKCSPNKNPFQPLHSSTPNPKTPKQKSDPTKTTPTTSLHGLNILTLKFQSLWNKRAELSNMV